jgi:hypothetical protein
LNAVKELNLSQWCIGAGTIRNIVFDFVQGIPETKPRDVDVAYFDRSDLTEETDKKYEFLLKEVMPEIPWEVTNQASVQLWYHRK